MKGYLKLLLTISLLILGKTWAGNEGHGGGAIVCRDRDTSKIVEAKLLDLWEAEALFHRKIERPETPMEEQLAEELSQIQKMDLETYGKVINALSIIRSNIVPVEKGVGLAPPRDMMNVFIKKGCAVEGVAIFDEETRTLHLDDEIFEAFSSTDKAALYVHEAIYKVFRESRQHENSIDSRRFIGLLFSEYLWKHVTSDIGAGAKLCQGGWYTLDANGNLVKLNQPKVSFFAFPLESGSGRYRMQFIRWGGYPLLEKTVADINGTSTLFSKQPIDPRKFAKTVFLTKVTTSSVFETPVSFDLKELQNFEGSPMIFPTTGMPKWVELSCN